MKFVEGDDGPPFRRPPDPDDRLWRHPSELGTRPLRRPTPNARTVWFVATVSAIGASVLTATLVVAVGSFDLKGPVTPTVPISDRTGSQGVADSNTSLPATTGADEADPSVPIVATDPLTAAAGRARASVVGLQITGTTRETAAAGVVLRVDGYVITNAHLLGGAVSITALTSDGRSYAAKVIGTDEATDVAVVKVDSPALEPARMATTGEVAAGQTAVAVGPDRRSSAAPSFLGGFVSSLDGTVATTRGTLYGMIETDTPVPAGLSGGALVDLEGRVIGIATSLDVPGRPGLGLAIPFGLARAVASQLIATGNATPTWLGIEGNDVDPTTARGLAIGGGAMVGMVEAGGPAARAGLAPHDVIVAIADRPVASIGNLVVALRMLEAGQVVDVVVIRDGARHTMAVSLAPRPPTP